MGKPKIGLQMLSLRSEAEIDFIGTLKKVKEIGYEAIEFAGFYQTPSVKLKAALEETGLDAFSAHVPLNFDNQKKMENDLKKEAEYAAEIGVKYIMIPWFPLPTKPIEADVEQYVQIVGKCSAVVREAGLQFGFHHQDGEFKEMDDNLFIDEVLKRVPPNEMAMEFNLGWMNYAGADIRSYLSKYCSRVPAVHFHDYKEEHVDTEVGEGVVGYDELLPYVSDLGIPYIIADQSRFEIPPLESVKKSLAFFQKAGYAGG